LRLTPRSRACLAWAAPVLVLFACVTAYWAPALLTDRTVQATYTDSDVVDYFRPISISQFQYAQVHGDLSDWNDRVGLGYPAVGQLGNQYIPRIAAMALAPSSGTASDLLVWTHALVAAFAAFALARRLGISRWPSVIAALAYVLGHLTVRWSPFFHATPYFAALPLAWLGIELIWQRERVRGGSLLALGITMACLGGHLQNAHMLLQVLALVMVFRWLVAGGSWRRRWPELAVSAVGYAAGLVLSLPALLSFVALQDVSNRSGSSDLGVIPGFTGGLMRSVLDPGTGVASLNGDLYLSVVAVPFIFAGIYAAVRSRELALVLLVALLALLVGMKTELLTLLADFVPGWRLISNAQRLSFVLTLPLALLAGAGIDLVSSNWRRLSARAFAAAGWVRAIETRVGWHGTWLPLVLAAASLALFLTLRRRTTWAVAGALGLALVTPLTASALAERSLGWSPRADSPPAGYAPWLSAVANHDDPGGRWMSWCEPLGFAFGSDTHRPVSFLEVPGRWLDTYDSFVPVRYFRYWRALTGSQKFVDPVGGQWYQDEPGNPPPNATLTDAAGVRRILAGNGCGAPAQALGWRRLDTVGNQTVWANDGAYPEAWVSHRWQSVADGDSQLAISHLASQPAAFAGHVDQIEGATAGGTGRGPEAVRLDRPTAEHLVARLQRPVASVAYLLVSEGYNGGWRASVAGSGRKLLAGDGAFQAVELKSGDKVVDIRFEPTSKTILTPLSYVLSCALVATVLGGIWYRWKRSPSQES
jgi:hypothetical protein